MALRLKESRTCSGQPRAAWNAIAITWAKTGDTKHATEAHWQTLDLFLDGLLARA